jgi:hypothetical protein
MSRILAFAPLLMLAAAAACSAATSGTVMQGAPATASASTEANFVQVIPHVAEQRVDVLVGGKPFTAYIWPNSLKKPVLYPLRTASGATVTRGYPLEPRAGERVDHPHHAGLWFNYGDVNGLDFWNNSTAIKAEDAPKMGTIVHRSVGETTSGRLSSRPNGWIRLASLSCERTPDSCFAPRTTCAPSIASRRSRRWSNRCPSPTTRKA